MNESVSECFKDEERHSRRTYLREVSIQVGRHNATNFGLLIDDPKEPGSYPLVVGVLSCSPLLDHVFEGDRLKYTKNMELIGLSAEQVQEVFQEIANALSFTRPKRIRLSVLSQHSDEQSSIYSGTDLQSISSSVLTI